MTQPIDIHLFEQIVEQAILTRGLQKKYYKERTQTALIDAKKAEAILDIQLQRYAVAKELSAKIHDPQLSQSSFLPPAPSMSEPG